MSIRDKLDALTAWLMVGPDTLRRRATVDEQCEADAASRLAEIHDLQRQVDEILTSARMRTGSTGEIPPVLRVLE